MKKKHLDLSCLICYGHIRICTGVKSAAGVFKNKTLLPFVSTVCILIENHSTVTIVGKHTLNAMLLVYKFF